MTVHLAKLCVGIASADELERRLARARREFTSHVTRNMPRRQAEVLDGGSLYWIIAGAFALRQRIAGLEAVIDSVSGTPACRIVLEARLVAVAPWPRRPFQGWRYLEAAEAPPDLALTETGAADGHALDLALSKLGLC